MKGDFPHDDSFFLYFHKLEKINSTSEAKNFKIYQQE